MLVYAVDPYVKRRIDDSLLWTHATKGDLMIICCGPIRQKQT